MPDNIILDPCPDCGCYVNIYYDDGQAYGVKCPKCRKVWIFWPVIAISGGIDAVVSAWNTSYYHDENTEEIEY